MKTTTLRALISLSLLALGCAEDDPLGQVEERITLPGDTSPINPPPRNASASAVGALRVDVRFTCGTHATRHDVVRQVAGSASWSPVGSLSACQAGSSVVVTDGTVDPNVTYCYAVWGSNSEYSAVSNTTCVTTPFDYSVPALPTVSIFNVTTSGVTVSITDRSTNESGFRIWARREGNLSWDLRGTFNRTVGAHRPTGEVLYFNDPTLESSRRYELFVEVFHDNWPTINQTAPITFTTAGPTPSSARQLEARVLSESVVELTWIDGAAELWYDVLVFRDGGLAGREVVAADTTSLVLRGLPPETLHCFKVVSRFPTTSLESNRVCVTTGSVEAPAEVR